MKQLTPAQKAEIKSEMIETSNPAAIICRFMEDGKTLANLTTGEFHGKGTNVIHLTHFWNFSEATAKKIADYTGLKAIITRCDTEKTIE